MPAIQDLVQSLTGKEPHKGVNPDEVVAVGAAVQAGRAEGRGQGRPAPRRHPAQPRHRDQGRGHAPAHRAQHDHPDQAVRGLHHRRGQPALGRDPRAAGRARDGHVQQDAGQVPAGRPAAGAAGHPPDRGHLRHRRQRDRARGRPGQGHRQGAVDDHHRPVVAAPRTTSSGWSATPRPTPRTTGAVARRPRCATPPTPSCTRPRSSCGTRATSSRAPRRRTSRRALQGVKDALAGHGHRGHQDGHRGAS